MLSKELLKGTLKTIVLKLLAEQGRMYGYEMTQFVKSQTAGKVLITEGALYPTLHKLEKDGLVKVEKVNIGKRIRKYYRLTAAGQKASKHKLAEFQEFVLAMQLIINPQMN